MSPRDQKVIDFLKRIEALATNPHWTADRRWTIAELATQAQRLMELSS